MEMGDQYGLADLRQLMAGRAHFPVFPPPPDQFSSHRNLTTSGHHYEMMMLGRQVAAEVLPPPRGALDFRSDSTTITTTTTTTNSASTTACGLEMEGCIRGEGGINGRWPRQETLTLLEIRSGLDSKFKEANQKGPLWDEVSRIMAEQHGYQRSGKKCREKFENLYKYYKKTKEGKSGRQDGKHYRFFRQLEALYGENTNPLLSASEAYVNAGNNTTIRYKPTNYMITTNFSNQETIPVQSQSISISSEFDTSSSEDIYTNDHTNDSLMEIKKNKPMSQSLKRGRKSWKAKIGEFIDSQMKKLIETQEAWLERMLKTLEQKEQERMLREEEWRKQEDARIDQEHKFWANERAWFEARDAALMESLKKFTGKELRITSSSSRSEEEVEEETLLMATKLHENNGNQNEDESEVLDQSIVNINKCLVIRRPNIKECNKKRKENTKTGSYNSLQNLDSSIYDDHQEGNFCAHHHHHHQARDVPEVSNCNGAGSTTGIMNDSCFRFLMSEGENSLWENYCVKLNKEENQ